MRENMRKIIELLAMDPQSGLTWQRNPSTRDGTEGYRLFSGERDLRDISSTDPDKSLK